VSFWAGAECAFIWVGVGRVLFWAGMEHACLADTFAEADGSLSFGSCSGLAGSRCVA
jgi:hypothetical protein